MTTLERPIKARRVGKLEKPAPLKRSLSVNTGVEEKLNSAITEIDNGAKQLCAIGNEIETDAAKENDFTGKPIGPGPQGYETFHAQLNWAWNLSCSFMLKCQ